MEPFHLVSHQYVPHSGPMPLAPETVLVFVGGQVVSTLPIKGVMHKHRSWLVMVKQLTAGESLLYM